MAKPKKISREEMRKLISSVRGKYKSNPGEKSGLKILMEGRAEDKRIEEEKFQRWFGGQGHSRV